MADFYDRLEAQLTDATARGVRRIGWPRPTSTRRWRGDWLAGAAALAVTLIVVAVFIGLGAGPRAGHRHLRPAGPAVVVNYRSHRLPALGGQLECATDLTPPTADRSQRGAFVVNTRPPTRYSFSLTASGLSRTVGSALYAVWLLPATQLSSGAYQLLSWQAPLLVGVIRPTVGATGRLAVQGLLPQSAAGAYLVRLTLQPRASSRTPGRTILQGSIDL
ncbi:MAG: hypothetical protein ACLP50_19270 [Solirubrobacteraceae bacterium]